MYLLFYHVNAECDCRIRIHLIFGIRSDPVTPHKEIPSSSQQGLGSDNQTHQTISMQDL